MLSQQQAPIIWAIGGNDPLNLAGIGADARAVTAAGGHCATIVTCVTGQNSKAFRASEPTSIAMLDAQWQALAEQTQPRVIKIGLLASAQQVHWLGDKLRQLIQHDPCVRVIYDPVLKASASDVDHSPQFANAVIESLLDYVDLLTPNTDEASVLSGQLIETPSDVVGAARSISRRFDINVLIKGGHLTPSDDIEPVCGDCFVVTTTDERCRYTSEPSTGFALTSPWIDGDNMRGTGCLLASLIAGFVAGGNTFGDAIVLANSVLHQGLLDATPCGDDRGGPTLLALPNKFEQLPHVLSLDEYCTQSTYRQTSIESNSCPKNLGLYPVVDSCQWLATLLAQGVKTIQLRAKGLTPSQAEPQIIEAIALGRKYNARVFINDYWQLALKHGAYGVHLGQEDLVLADLDTIKRAGLRLGLSTHGILEALMAYQLKPSYIALGHIFATQTKDMPSKPQGIESLALQVKLFADHASLVAIGGISAARVDSILSTNIGSVALVSAITNAQDVPKITNHLLQQVGDGGEHCYEQTQRSA